MVILLIIEPGAPQNVRATKILAHEITLDWKPPAQSKGSLTYEVYQVSIRRIHNITIWQGSLEVNWFFLGWDYTPQAISSGNGHRPCIFCFQELEKPMSYHVISCLAMSCDIISYLVTCNTTIFNL